jgi:predicted DNA-binding protein (MmcQ/YjbR family)
VKEIGARFTRPVFARVRRLCLAPPETHESTSWGHPNFRAGTKTFCTFEMIKDRPSMAFRLPPADVDRMLRRQGFFATPYGRGLWVSWWVDDRVNWKLMAALVDRSYRCVAMKRMRTALASRSEPAPTARAQRTTVRGKKTP